MVCSVALLPSVVCGTSFLINVITNYDIIKITSLFTNQFILPVHRHVLPYFESHSFWQYGE